MLVLNLSMTLYATMQEAYPGDIIGINNPGHFAIGDTIFTGSTKVRFPGIPSFSPECFAYMRNPNPSKYKNYRKGLDQVNFEPRYFLSTLMGFALLCAFIVVVLACIMSVRVFPLHVFGVLLSLTTGCCHSPLAVQLLDEGAVQMLRERSDDGNGNPILAAVGTLQFDGEYHTHAANMGPKHLCLL